MSAVIAAGWAPNHFSFYEEEMVKPDEMGDAIAKIVMQRFRDARQHKNNNSVYQGKSTVRLLREADYAMEKRYSPDQARAFEAAFGYCPSRYYGLSETKVAEISAWKSEIVSADPGSLVKIVPTPDPRLPTSSVSKIKEAVKQELVERMLTNGMGDPAMLMSVDNGRLHDSVKRFLEEKAQVLRDIEQAKIMQAAMSAANRVQVKMRDVVIEGGFREAYSSFNLHQFKYGIGILRYPVMQRRVVLSSDQDMKGKLEREWKVVPTFQTVSPHNFFPMSDGRTVSDVTAIMEYKEFSKTAIVGMASDPRYDKQAILDILNDYSMRSRTWMFPESSNTESENGESSTYWGPDEVVSVLYHEGFATGKDLQDHGLTGYDDTKIYDIVAEVCCGRTIRLEVKNPLKASPRSYATTKYEETGFGIWQTAGVPAILWDTQERLNTMLALFESNIDESSRPPLLVNPEALKNPAEAMTIRAGSRVQISDLLGPGVSPDPVRVIKSTPSIFQIIWPLCQQLIRQADHECGVVSLSEMASFGRGSLGELSARISQAVRRVRNAAYEEDRAMKTVWESLYQWVLEENPKLVENVDLSMNYLGVVGLLSLEAEKQAKMERLGVIMQATQAGAVTPDVAKFGYHDILRDLGVPLEALSNDDPLTTNAIAAALSTGSIAGGAGAGMAGPPKLDGRSGAISSVPTAVAAPSGASTATPPPPI